MRQICLGHEQVRKKVNVKHREKKHSKHFLFLQIFVLFSLADTFPRVREKFRNCESLRIFSSFLDLKKNNNKEEEKGENKVYSCQLVITRYLLRCCTHTLVIPTKHYHYGTVFFSFTNQTNKCNTKKTKI